jgi:hypothetical protein
MPSVQPADAFPLTLHCVPVKSAGISQGSRFARQPAKNSTAGHSAVFYAAPDANFY